MIYFCLGYLTSSRGNVRSTIYNRTSHRSTGLIISTVIIAVKLFSLVGHLVVQVVMSLGLSVSLASGSQIILRRLVGLLRSG